MMMKPIWRGSASRIWISSRRRLVEEDEARRARQRHADLELALLAVGELGNELAGHGIEMHRMGEVMGAAPRAILLAGPDEAEAPAGHAA